MEICKVVKQVISTVKNDVFNGYPLLLVQPLNMKMQHKGAEVLCIDFVGASINEIVMIMKEGSSVNDMMGLEEAPADAAIIGIVDQIMLDDRKIFDKSNAEAA
ncbi:MAG: ethanolamine utilization protein EutN [Erysipelotrichia bacterium]|nr:EutN/CcmL family microcompartment protein [Candidatus Riflebacteria bacterium]NCB38623.1 ethanolamine utilization protein EutN [Erysipelotrichia bacterium]